MGWNIPTLAESNGRQIVFDLIENGAELRSRKARLAKVMEVQTINLIRQNVLAATNVLLMHTIGGIAQIVVTLMLVRTLVSLHREDRVPKGFFPIAALISLASLARATRLIYTWLAPLPPRWLNALTVLLLFMTMLTIPIILSTNYVGYSISPRWRWSAWIQRAMIANALSAVLTCGLSIILKSAYLLPLICSVTLTISGSLLMLLASKAQNLQIRQRGLILFASLTSAGLLGVSANLFLGFIAAQHQFRHIHIALAMEWSTAWQEFSNILIVLGMLFVFASLRLSDVLIKHALKLYIWCLTPLCGWAIATEVYSRFQNRIIHDASLSLWAIMSLAALAVGALLLSQKSDNWVDRWVFQVPSFTAALHRFAEHLRSIDELQSAYGASEDIVRTTLSIASARIVATTDVPFLSALSHVRSGPHFLTKQNELRLALSPVPDVVVPLSGANTSEHWIALSQGVARPPLTSAELDFVSQVSSELRRRLTAIEAEEIRLDRQRKEAALREEITSAELKALRAQINPHFLFNSLNTIADLSIVEPKKAEEMTLRLAAVFRYVLVNGDQQFITVSEELEFVRSYLDIEQTRFEERLTVQFDVETSVLKQRIPTLLLQPLVENAIKHGIAPRMHGGTLKISAHRISDGIKIVVADDGVGLGTIFSNDSSERSTHVGLSNTERRLRAAYGDKASFRLTPGRSGGSDAIITIHCEEEGA